MATNPVDFLSALGGLQSMPGSYAIGQQVQNDQAQLQQRQAQSSLLQVQTQAAQQQLAEEAAYKEAAANAIKDGSPAAIASLITRFPKQQAAVAKGWEIKNAAEKQADIASVGSVLSALDNGKADLAASTMEARIAAEDAAGQDTTADKAALAAIRSGDQAAINAIRGSLRYTLASVVPDKMADVLEKVGGAQKDKTHVVTAGGALVDDTGKELYRAADKPEYRSVAPGETLIQLGGGDSGPAPTGLSGSDIEAAALSAFPGTTVTSRQRTPEHNAAVGGVPNSQHLTDHARDFVPPQGISMAQFATTLRKQLPGAKIINEGDHVHIQAPTGGGGGSSRVVAQGAAKPEYAMLSPAENKTLGLDPNVRYQRSPTGEITALGGQNKAQLKPLPAPVNSAIIDMRSNLRQVDEAIAAIKARPKSIGLGTGALGDTFTQWNDEAGTDTRAKVGKIAGQTIHDVSGAAVTAAEEPRFKPYVAMTTDKPAVAITKLNNYKKQLMDKLNDFYGTYSEEQGYRPFAPTQAAAAPSAGGFKILRVRPAGG